MHPFDYYQQLKLLEDERERERERDTINRERDNANYYASLGFNCSYDNHRTKGTAHLINGKWQKAINFNEVYACPRCNGHYRNMYNHHTNLANQARDRMNTVNQRIVDYLTPMFHSTNKR